MYKLNAHMGAKISLVGISRHKKCKQIFFRERQIGLKGIASENTFF